jgi:hypothetical protein
LLRNTSSGKLKEKLKQLMVLNLVILNLLNISVQKVKNLSTLRRVEKLVVVVKKRKLEVK